MAKQGKAWPAGYKKIQSTKVDNFMVSDKDTKEIGYIDRNELVNSIEITGELIDPIAPGTAQAPAVIPAGPAGQKRKFTPAPGFYFVGGTTREVTSDNRWEMFWSDPNWQLRDLGKLPDLSKVLPASAKSNWIEDEVTRLTDGTLLVANKNTTQAPAKDQSDWDPVGGDDTAKELLTSYTSDGGGTVDPLVYQNYLITNPGLVRTNDEGYRTVEVDVTNAHKLRYQGRHMITSNPPLWAAIVGERSDGKKMAIEPSRGAYIDFDKTYDVSNFVTVYVTYNYNHASEATVIPSITLLGENEFAQPDGVYKSVESVQRQLEENRLSGDPGSQTFLGSQAFNTNAGAGYLKTLLIPVKAGQKGNFKVYTDFAILDYYDKNLNLIGSPLNGSGVTVQSNASYTFPQDGFISVITGSNLSTSSFTLSAVGRIYLNAFKSISGSPRAIDLSENRYHDAEQITTNIELELLDLGSFGMVNAFRFRGGGVVFGGAFDIAPGSKAYDPSLWNTIYIYNSYNRPTVLIVN
ncbi:hypothetical protein [Sphingobacterium corticibacter]|uniref:Uncharacterized protein n=1 Tax=Sphingobacterium corticibacter TaxID=2171749 RepID=A0A2T8HNI8_9SPHI|nr:hypothetical protein [Sphingobacterium corticibacter]PVH27014.1 hypothetical protein DC487_05305 [Sphingobacterium corticibacter]